MGHRRRRGVGALIAATLVVAACADEAPTESLGAATTPTTSATSVPATTIITTTTSTNTETTSSTTSSTTSVPVTSTNAPCSRYRVVVLGNSTDYWPDYVVGAEGPTADAWPALLEESMTERLPDIHVEVNNASVLGAGFDLGLYGVVSMQQRLAELSASLSTDVPTLLIVAPSVVDLQLRSLDVAASSAAFDALLADAAASFEDILVLPMNPVASGFSRAVSEAIAAFNTALVAEGIVGPGVGSVLLSDDGITGRVEFYDDFDDERRDTPGPDPDGLHPDTDGHAALAASLVDPVAARVLAGCG